MFLQLDLEENVSLSYCLKKFSKKELMNLGNKIMCESCNTKQVATKHLMIKERPKLLLIHLKRFKLNPQIMQYQKLNYRIPYPSVLHIEDNQIYNEQETGEEIEEPQQKNFSQEQSIKEDLGKELDLNYNEYL